MKTHVMVQSLALEQSSTTRFKVSSDLQKMRDAAETISREERARTLTTRLLNAAPRPATHYESGDHVCVWRSATLKSRKRDDTYNPKARFDLLVQDGLYFLNHRYIQIDEKGLFGYFLEQGFIDAHHSRSVWQQRPRSPWRC